MNLILHHWVCEWIGMGLGLLARQIGEMSVGFTIKVSNLAQSKLDTYSSQ